MEYNLLPNVTSNDNKIYPQGTDKISIHTKEQFKKNNYKW